MSMRMGRAGLRLRLGAGVKLGLLLGAVVLSSGSGGAIAAPKKAKVKKPPPRGAEISDTCTFGPNKVTVRLVSPFVPKGKKPLPNAPLSFCLGPYSDTEDNSAHCLTIPSATPIAGRDAAACEKFSGFTLREPYGVFILRPGTTIPGASSNKDVKLMAITVDLKAQKPLAQVELPGPTSIDSDEPVRIEQAGNAAAVRLSSGLLAQQCADPDKCKRKERWLLVTANRDGVLEQKEEDRELKKK